MSGSIGSGEGDAPELDLWGCRGSRSLPEGRSRIARFTSCYSLRSGDTLVVLDAGRGVAQLAAATLTEPRFAGLRSVVLLVSHAHVDHWEGIKDADWLWQRGNGARLLVCGPAEALGAIRAAYEPPAYVPLEVLASGTAASFDYQPLFAGETRTVGAATITALPLHHYSGAGSTRRPIQTLGYRVSAGGAVLSYLSDHEPLPETEAVEAALTDGAHLVVCDAHYLDRADQQYGHGSLESTAALARRLPAALVLAAHHGSSHSDERLEAALRRHGEDAPNLRLGVEGQGYRFDAGVGRFLPR